MSNSIEKLQAMVKEIDEKMDSLSDVIRSIREERAGTDVDQSMILESLEDRIRAWNGGIMELLVKRQ